MNMKNKKNVARLLFLFCTPKLAERATKLYAADSIPLHYRMSASGTASSGKMSMKIPWLKRSKLSDGRMAAVSLRRNCACPRW